MVIKYYFEKTTSYTFEETVTLLLPIRLFRKRIK
jgi:hypothetical protein